MMLFTFAVGIRLLLLTKSGSIGPADGGSAYSSTASVTRTHSRLIACSVRLTASPPFCVAMSLAWKFSMCFASFSSSPSSKRLPYCCSATFSQMRASSCGV